MKQGLAVIGILLILGIAAVWLASANVNRALKSGIERTVPRFTKTPVTVDAVDFSRRTGGVVRGLVIGNPPSRVAPYAIRFGEVTVALDPASVGRDKLVIRSLRFGDTDVTLEGGLQDNNLKQLMESLQNIAGGGGPGVDDRAVGQKLQVDELVLTGGRVHVNIDIPVVRAEAVLVTLPDIQLHDLGTGPEGISPAELSRVLMQEVMNQAVAAATKNLGGATRSLIEPGAKPTGGGFEQATKALEELLKNN